MLQHYASQAPVSTNGGKVNIVLQAVQQFASSYGLKPFKAVVLKDAAVIQAIQSLAPEPALKNRSAHIIVFAIRTAISKVQIDDYLAGILTRKKASASSLNSYNKYLTNSINNQDHNGMSWAAKQVILALNHVTATAAQQNVPVTLLQDIDLAQVDRILGFAEKQLRTVAVLAMNNDGDDLTTSLTQMPKEKELLFELM